MNASIENLQTAGWAPTSQVSGWRSDEIGVGGEQRATAGDLVQAKTENEVVGEPTSASVVDEFDVVVICGDDGVVRFITSSVVALLGYASTSIVGRHVRNFVDPSDWHRIEMLLPQIVGSASRVATVAVSAIDADGKRVQLECVVTNLLDVPGLGQIVLRLRRTSTDRLAFQELWRREQWFRSLLDTLNDLVIVLDRDHRVVYVNATVEQILGFGPDELVDAPMARFIDADDLPAVQQALLNAEASGHPCAPISCRLRHEDGAVSWIELVATARIEDGELKSTVIAARDMTQRQQVEERLRLLESAVTRLEDSVIVLEAVEPRAVIFANPAACELTGWTMQELTSSDALTMLVADPGVAGIQTLHEALQEKRSATAEHELVRRDGTAILIHTSVAPVIDESGETTHIIAIMRDLTEEHRLEVELRHAQKLEAMGRLSAGIAHEINTPIQFIGDNVQFLSGAFLGVVELLGHYRRALRNADELSWIERKGRLDEAEETADVDFLEAEVPRALEEAVEGIDRVATIVRAMKAFGHPDNVDQRSADLNEALRNTLTVARNELKYVADVVTDFGELPPIICHLGDLNQVFLNLLVNAAHAVSATVGNSGDLGTITVRTRHAGDNVVVAISDTGCGIAPEHRAYLFEPFFTTKEQGHGTGQGLALARTIVQERHGGTIDYETEVGIGTTFSVHLPMRGRQAGRES